MEINLLSRNGISEDSILSIRAGAIKRQAPVSSGRPFRFPKLSMEDNPLRVAILQQVGTAYLVLKPTDGSYHVKFDSGVSCEVGVKKAAVAEDAGRAAESGIKATAASATEAKEYLERHQILTFVQAVLQAVIKERPTDPYQYMARHFTSGYPAEDARSDETKVAAPPPPPAAERAEQVEQAKQTAQAERAEQVSRSAPPPATGAEPAAATLQEASAGQEEAAGSPAPRAPLELTLPAAAPDAAGGAPDSARLEVLRTQLHDTLIKANQSGALASSLKKVQQDVVPRGAGREDLRLQIQETLLKASESGALAAALPLAAAGQPAGEARVEAENVEELRKHTQSALLEASGSGKLADAMQEVRAGTFEELCSRTRSILLKASGDGSLDTIIQAVVGEVGAEENGPKDQEETCRTLQDALVKGAEEGTLASTIRSVRASLADAAATGAEVAECVEKTRATMKNTLLEAARTGSLAPALEEVLAAG